MAQGLGLIFLEILILGNFLFNGRYLGGFRGPDFLDALLGRTGIPKIIILQTLFRNERDGLYQVIVTKYAANGIHIVGNRQGNVLDARNSVQSVPLNNERLFTQLIFSQREVDDDDDEMNKKKGRQPQSETTERLIVKISCTAYYVFHLLETRN